MDICFFIYDLFLSQIYSTMALAAGRAEASQQRKNVMADCPHACSPVQQ